MEQSNHGQPGLSPVLVGRQEELSQLEDALLSANRGDGQFVLLAGEAGIGKTRLARSSRGGLASSAVRCSGGVARRPSSPSLPFVEAIGSRLGDDEAALVRAELGPMAAELGQVFPQLGEGSSPAAGGDPAQAKVRLFESVVALLELWARAQTLLVVLDDVHWADASTRELLEYASRRLASSRVMLLATYRSDELDRTYPLTRVVQVWRRSGLADAVAVEPIGPAQVAEMIAAILATEDVDLEVGLVHDRSEGNPFVLEEMLKEALDRGRPLDGFQLELPETVREAVLSAWAGSTRSTSRSCGLRRSSADRSTTRCSSRSPRPTRPRCSRRWRRPSRSSCSSRRPKPPTATAGGTH